MRAITRIKRSTKAISPTISVLLMIAIAVAASLIAYAWIMGYLGGSTTKSGKAILIQSIAADEDGKLVVYVQNVGIGAVQFDPDACVYIDDLQKLCSVDGSGDVVTAVEGQTVKMLVAYDVPFDVRIKVKVVTLEGIFSEITDSISAAAATVYEIAASAGTGGTINPSGTVPVVEGSSKTFTITANAGYNIADVLVDGGSVGAVGSYTFTDVQEDHTIAASFSQGDYALAITVVGNGHVDAVPATGPYHFGDSVELTAVADAGWSFSAWSGDLTGSTNPDTVTIDETPAVTATFTQDQYTLTVTPSGSGSVAKVPEKATYTYGESVQLTANPATGWSFSAWSGALSGSANPTNIVMDGNKAVTATFTQNSYTLSVGYAGTGTGTVVLNPPGGTYTHGTVVTLTANPAVDSDFVGWSGALSGTTNPQQLTMDGPKSVTAAFDLKQFTVTFAQTGLDGDATGTVVTVNGVPKAYADLPFTTLPVNRGDTVSYSYAVPGSSVGGKQFLLNGVSGPASPVSGPATVTGNYKTQYFLTVTSDHDSPTPTSGWFDSNTLISASVTSPADDAGGTQYVCSGWTRTGSVPGSGSNTSMSFNIVAPTGITWNWQTQYYLTVSSAYGIASGQGWYNSGATAYAGLNIEEIDHGNGTKHVFESWGTDASGTNFAQSDDIAMSGPKTATANWQTQYYFTITSDRDSPTPASGWIPSGTFVTTSVTSPADEAGGIRYRCTGWTGTGSVPASGIDVSVGFTITEPSTITWNWQTQYRLTMATNFGTTTPAVGDTWYDAGSTLTITAAAPGAGAGERYVWNGWTGAGSVSYTGIDNPATNMVTMNGPITETASWTRQYQVIFAVSPVGAGTTTPSTPTWYNAGSSGNPISATANSGYVFSSWSSDPPSSLTFPTPTTMTVNSPGTATANFNGPKLVFIPAAGQSLSVGTVSSARTVQRQDANGNPVTTGGAITVNLATTSTGGGFYDSASATHVIYSIQILSGQSTSASFYYLDYTVGSPTLTGSSGSLTPATTTFTITGTYSEPRYSTTISPTSAAAGTTVSFTYRVTMQTNADVDISYVNITVPAGFTIISVNSPTSSEGSWSRQVNGNVITLISSGTSADLEGTGDYVQVVFSATVPSSTGTYTFASSVWGHFADAGWSYTLGPGTNTGTDPTVTVTNPPQTLTLRPNAAGTTTQLSTQGSGTGNWDRVEEVTADESTTYVYGTGDDSWQTDTYNVLDQSLAGTITNVRIYIRASESETRDDVFGRTAIRIGTGSIQYGTQLDLTTSWTNYYTDYATKTGNLGSGAWTWADINNLQIGVSLQSHYSSGSSTWRYARCTQVWVEITYTPS